MADPFAGSGVLAYSAEISGRTIEANEWEPYTNRMASAPWRQLDRAEINRTYAAFKTVVSPQLNWLYKTICTCGHEHVLDSLFFDRVPLRMSDIDSHERLGPNGENITYRQHKCPNCAAAEKHFDASDAAHLAAVEASPVPPKYVSLFATKLIPNSRINLSGDSLIYGNLFPHRSQLALSTIWEAIQQLQCSAATRTFFEDVFLSILFQAKYKDYRSKSQDLHVPNRTLRETNLQYSFENQLNKRLNRLAAYGLAPRPSPIACSDFREFLAAQPDHSVQLVLTDPPWSDGNAYFEKAQFFHPWMGYDLNSDKDRLAREVVISDSPARLQKRGEEQWWKDISEFFIQSARVTSDYGYLALFFRPVPPNRWLVTLNRLKVIARAAGFEPLLTVDASGNDPSMRIQQSASFVFSKDLIFTFLKLPKPIRRLIISDVDIDYLAFKAGELLQEEHKGPFGRKQWRAKLSEMAKDQDIHVLDLPKFEPDLGVLFERYMVRAEGYPGSFLPRPDTPFSGQLFDLPAAERLFTYVPLVVNDLCAGGKTFSYDMFLLKLAEYVENGTRMLINEIETMDLKSALKTYARPAGGAGSRFEKLPAPKLPNGIRTILELDPYEFEAFVARLLRMRGYTDVAVIGRTGDRGVDVVGIDEQGQKTVVQCKRYLRNKVGSEPIQRLHSFSITRGAERRIVITTSSFTNDARDEAIRTDTELVNGKDLEVLVAPYFADLFKAEPGEFSILLGHHGHLDEELPASFETQESDSSISQ
ncbi:restriction endonuclease [Arthrobacter rhombi]|uniref:restriction endonuclease n=1 Tax=Arthrobacter rhombi TaxID=71253 RepID=UPI003FD5F37F